MTAEKDFIVRIENPQGFGSGLLYSPAGQSEEAYVLTARHALVGDNGIPWEYDELSVGFLTDNGWSEYKLQEGDVILFGENNATEDLGVLVIKKQFLPVSLDYDRCPGICLVPAKGHELEITGFPKVVLNKLKRTLHHLKPLKDRDYERQIQIEVSDPLTGEYNDDNLVEGYSGSPVFVKLNGRYFCCGLFLAYETKNKRILGIDLSLVNNLLASRSLPLLSLLQIETDPTVLEAAEKLNENSFRVLSRIRDSVGKVNLPRTEISAAALEVIRNGKLAIFTGKPGSGKSAMVKKILDGLKNDFEIFAFQGEQLDKKSIEEIFADKPFCFGISLSEVLDSPLFAKKKIFLIDSIEKILETDNAETILDFFELLFRREDITLVFTCRSYAAEHLKIRFLRQFPAFPDFDVPALDGAELECIAESYPMLRTLAKNKSLLKVLQIPFNLDKAVSLPQNSLEDDIDTEARFKQIMWEYVIEGREKESDPLKRQLRGETFMEIALKRASAMSAYATVGHARADILHELTADHIIDPEPVYRRSFAAAHDIYEDWALTRHIDSNYLQYIAEEGNYGAFYDAIGTSPAVRRAFRIWISEKIQAMDGSAGRLVKSTLNGSAIQNYWKDEILVAVMQSHYSSDFLRENKDFLFLDQFKYFIRIIFLVRVSCQKPDFSLLNALDVDKRTQVYHNINLVPYGEVWANLIEFIFLNLNLLQPQMRLILSMLLQWEKGLKKNGPFPAGAEHAAKILIWFYNNFTSGVSSDQGRAKTENLENGILMLFRLSDFVKDQLKSLIEDAFRNKNRDADFEIGNLYDKILEYALDGYEGQKICKNFPELVLEIAESKWFYYPPTPEQIAEMKRQSILGPYHRSMMHSEQDFGFRRSTERHYSPGSPYETPILNLLLYSPFATVDFLVKLFNHAADSYIKSDFGRDNEFLHPSDHRSQITVIMDDGREIKQHASPSLWMMFRGTYFNSPDVLKSCLMAAECYLLQIGRDIKENKHDQYTKFLKASWDYTFEAFLTRCNSVMGSAVLISVANEHMDLAGRRIFPLLKIREIYHLDFHRCLKESEAYSPLSYKKHRQLRHLQLQNFQTLKHRSKSIEDLVMNLSFGEFQTEIFEIIDNFYLENPTDQNWRFALARIDRRKFRIVKEVENGFLLETELEDDLQKVVEENKTKEEANHLVLYAAHWCMQKLKHETAEEDSYEKWSEFHKISVDAQDNINIAGRHKQPVLVAAIGIRDFYSSLSAAESEWCETKVNELFKYELFENRLLDFMNSKYTVYETDAAFSVVPILMLKSDEREKKIYKQNILYYLTHFHQRSEHNSLRASINSCLWKHDPGFVLNCIYCIVEYSKFSHLKHRLEHLSGYKSYKRNFFSIIKTAHYRIRLKINPHYKPKGRIAGHIKYNDALKQYSAGFDAIMNRVAEEETPVEIAIPEYQSNAGDWLFEALKLVPAETELKILRDYFKNVLNFIFETFAKDSDPYDDTIHHSLQYIRVSTDEQAEKGFSQRNQEEMLRKYCGINRIQIRNVIYEDHSAKTFNRPQWKKFLADIKKRKHKISLVLFMKWDRFSRNAGDAYQMINQLRALGVEPQAIEQPLDLSVPENKMMLAFYLAAPEVENDRRALNTFQGLRRGKKEGRHMGMAPYGYANKVTEDGKKYIAIVPDKAANVVWVYEQIAKNIFSTESIYQTAKEKGMGISKNNMWLIIRNPLYCGMIVVPKYRDEEERLVKGQHDPIISQDLFYKVQDILNSKARTYRPKIKTIENFPLRGFFVCPKCGQKLGGSKCRGRSRDYFYYHCDKVCKWRVNSEMANSVFKGHLNKFKPLAEVRKLYSAVLLEAYREHTGLVINEKKKSLEQIGVYEKKLAVARNLLVTEKIDADDYHLMKTEYNAEISRLENEIGNVDEDRADIESLMNTGLQNLIKLGEAFGDGSLVDSREIIGLIFPENFTFQNNKIQTARVNEMFKCIYLVNNRLRAKKNGTKDDIFLLSRVVTGTGQISTFFLDDLKKLAYYM